MLTKSGPIAADGVADMPTLGNKAGMFFRCTALALMVASCAPPVGQGPVERIEIRQSGWESVDISVASTGVGSFERTGLGLQSVTGSFRISPGYFRSMEERLAEFRKHAVPRTDASIQELGNMRCPEGLPFVTDNGAIYVRWIGEGFDEHYLASLGCDKARNADRNSKLLGIVRNLPVPAP